MYIGSAGYIVSLASLAGTFPYLAGLFGGAPLFAFVAFMMVLQLLFVKFIMSETKGVSLEELEQKLAR